MIDIFSKYPWVVPLKDKKYNYCGCISKNFKWFKKKTKPNMVREKNEFYSRSMKSWLQKNSIEMYLTIETEGRQRKWTPHFSFKKHIKCYLLWSEPWCAVSNVQMQFSISSLMWVICLYLKISIINLHEYSKLTMLLWL